MADSDIQRGAQELFRRTMTERLGDSEKGKMLAQMLLPSFPVGCRRQTPGPGYLEALVQDNVDTWWDDIAKITEKGILTKSGEELGFDVICCATGFDTSFQPSFPLIGRGGVDLAKRWSEEPPSAYFGIAVPDFPNYFGTFWRLLSSAFYSPKIKLNCCSLYWTRFPHFERILGPGYPDDGDLHLQMHWQATNWVHTYPRYQSCCDQRLQWTHSKVPETNCVGWKLPKLV